MSRIVPVPKVDNPSGVSDFRPISILPALSKVFESLINDQLNEYLTDHNLMCSFQSGFRKNCSTTTALIKIENDVREALGESKITALVLLDFSKAFDSINHQLLCHKLRTLFLFENSAVKLIGSYLSERYQFVDFNSTRSDIQKNPRGVPQGSILGPTLFSMFINDLPTVLNYGSYHLYADDFQLYLSGSTDELDEIIDKINQDLRKIEEWCHSNGLILNAKKTQAILFRKSSAVVNPTCIIKIGNVPIIFSNQVKNLGIVFDSNLSWKPQISALCCKIYYSLHALVCLRDITPFNIRMKLAKTLLVPLFQYCDVIFSSANATIFKKLQVAFNSVTRYVHCLSKFDHISQHSKSILGCTFQNYLTYRHCNMVHKILHEGPPYLTELFTRCRSVRTNNLVMPRIRSNVIKYSFRVRGICKWNNLPASCKVVNSYSQFKSSSFMFISSLS